MRHLFFTRFAYAGMVLIVLVVAITGCSMRSIDRLDHPSKEIVCAAYLLKVDVPHQVKLAYWPTPAWMVPVMCPDVADYLHPDYPACSTNRFGLVAGESATYDAYIADDVIWPAGKYPELHEAAHVVMFQTPALRALALDKYKAEEYANWVEAQGTRCGSGFVTEFL